MEFDARQSQTQCSGKPCSAVEYFFLALGVPTFVCDVGSRQIDYSIKIGVF